MRAKDNIFRGIREDLSGKVLNEDEKLFIGSLVGKDGETCRSVAEFYRINNSTVWQHSAYYNLVMSDGYRKSSISAGGSGGGEKTKEKVLKKFVNTTIGKRELKYLGTNDTESTSRKSPRFAPPELHISPSYQWEHICQLITYEEPNEGNPMNTFHNKMAVVKYDTNTGRIMREFSNVAKAADYEGLNYALMNHIVLGKKRNPNLRVSYKYKRNRDDDDDEEQERAEKEAKRARSKVWKKAWREAKGAEKRAEKEASEAEKRAEMLAAKEAKEVEIKAAKEAKEAEKLAAKEAKEAKEAEKRAEKEAREAAKRAEMLAAKEAKEVEKRAEKEAREAAKRAEKEAMEAEKKAAKEAKAGEKLAAKEAMAALVQRLEIDSDIASVDEYDIAIDADSPPVVKYSIESSTLVCKYDNLITAVKAQHEITNHLNIMQVENKLAKACHNFGVAYGFGWCYEKNWRKSGWWNDALFLNRSNGKRFRCEVKKTFKLSDIEPSRGEFCDCCFRRAYEFDDSTEAVLLKCACCSVCVHDLCYGVTKLPKPSKEWLCAACRVGQCGNKIDCALCEHHGGAFEPAACTKNRWVHVSCAKLTPQIYCIDAKKMKPWIIKHVDKRRFSLKCCHRGCLFKDGNNAKGHVKAEGKNACIQCATRTCYKAIHPRCALLPDSPFLFIESGVVVCDKCVESVQSGERRRKPKWAQNSSTLELRNKVTKTSMYRGACGNRNNVEEYIEELPQILRLLYPSRSWLEISFDDKAQRARKEIRLSGCGWSNFLNTRVIEKYDLITKERVAVFLNRRSASLKLGMSMSQLESKVGRSDVETQYGKYGNSNLENEDFTVKWGKFSIFDKVKTPYGIGEVLRLRRDGVVVLRPMNWRLAGGQSPILYLHDDQLTLLPQHNDPLRIYDQRLVERCNIDTGEITHRFETPNIVEEDVDAGFTYDDAILCLRGQLSRLGLFRYQLSKFISKDKVMTHFGPGEVIGIRFDGMIEVELDNWTLLNDGPVIMYLNEDSVWFTEAQDFMRFRGFHNSSFLRDRGKTTCACIMCRPLPLKLGRKDNDDKHENEDGESSEEEEEEEQEQEQEPEPETDDGVAERRSKRSSAVVAGRLIESVTANRIHSYDKFTVALLKACNDSRLAYFSREGNFDTVIVPNAEALMESTLMSGVKEMPSLHEHFSQYGFQLIQHYQDGKQVYRCPVNKFFPLMTKLDSILVTKTTKPERHLHEEVDTQFGKGIITNIRCEKDNIYVVRLESWLLANERSPLVYLHENSIKNPSIWKPPVKIIELDANERIEWDTKKTIFEDELYLKRKVVQLDPHTHDIVKIHKSFMDAVKSVCGGKTIVGGVCGGNSIKPKMAVLKKAILGQTQKYGYGYVWRFVIRESYAQYNSYGVNEYNMATNEIVESFPSVQACLEAKKLTLKELMHYISMNRTDPYNNAMTLVKKADLSGEKDDIDNSDDETNDEHESSAPRKRRRALAMNREEQAIRDREKRRSMLQDMKRRNMLHNKKGRSMLQNRVATPSCTRSVQAKGTSTAESVSDDEFAAEIRVGEVYQAIVPTLMNDEDPKIVDYEHTELLWSFEQELDEKVRLVLSHIAERDRSEYLKAGLFIIAHIDDNRKYVVIMEVAGEGSNKICTVFDGFEYKDVSIFDCDVSDTVFEEMICQAVYEIHQNADNSLEICEDYATTVEGKALSIHKNSGLIAQELSAVTRDKLGLKYLEWSYDEVCDFSVGIEVQRGAKHEYRNYTKKYLIASEEVADLDLIRVWKHMKKKRTLMEVMDMFHRILISYCQGNLKALQKLYFTREKIANADEIIEGDHSNSAL